jgi:INO80 complex subunit B
MVWDSSQPADIGSCSTDDEEKEEREWLAALEAGELDDNGDLKRGRDPSVLTCRQVITPMPAFGNFPC